MKEKPHETEELAWRCFVPRKSKGEKQLERAEAKILNLLKGWDITAIESLLARLCSEAKRRAKLP